MWKTPTFNPGQRVSAGKLQQLSDGLSLLLNSKLANGSIGPSGILTADTLPESIWVRVLDTDNQYPPAHTWEEVIQIGDSDFDTKSDGLYGNPNSMPLFEVNNRHLPDNLIVRAWRGMGDYYFAVGLSTAWLCTTSNVPQAVLQGGRTVYDGSYIEGTNTVTSATADFTSADVNALLGGDAFPLQVCTIATTANSNVITSSNADFKSSHVGMSISFVGSGSTPAYIASVVNANTAICTNSAFNTTSGILAQIGSQALITAVNSSTSVTISSSYLPSGSFTNAKLVIGASTTPYLYPAQIIENPVASLYFDSPSSITPNVWFVGMNGETVNSAGNEILYDQNGNLIPTSTNPLTYKYLCEYYGCDSNGISIWSLGLVPLIANGFDPSDLWQGSESLQIKGNVNSPTSLFVGVAPSTGTYIIYGNSPLLLATSETVNQSCNVYYGITNVTTGGPIGLTKVAPLIASPVGISNDALIYSVRTSNTLSIFTVANLNQGDVINIWAYIDTSSFVLTSFFAGGTAQNGRGMGMLQIGNGGTAISLPPGSGGSGGGGGGGGSSLNGFTGII